MDEFGDIFDEAIEEEFGKPEPLEKQPLESATVLGTVAVQRASVAASLEHVVKLIRWNAAPDALRQGDLSSLSESIAETIRLAATLPEIDAAAQKAGLDPVIFVLGLLARAADKENRTAARIARAIFGPSPASSVASAAAAIGL
jgi:hypothetical protein